MATTTTDLSKPYIPVIGHVTDGYSKESEATATCFCGTVQLAFVSAIPSFLFSLYPTRKESATDLAPTP